MNEITTKQLQNHIGSYLQNLPLKLTRRGKPVAVVLSWLAWEKLADLAEGEGRLTKGLAEGKCTDCNRWTESFIRGTYLKKNFKLCRACFEKLKLKISKEGGEVTIE